jgi:predicted  nucleic acid-binding Zn-ribbon protein
VIWTDSSESKRGEATTTRSFAAADQLAKEVRTYKQERVQLRTELATLQKEKRHKSYVLKKQQPAAESECESIVDLTGQSSDTTKGPLTNEADESEPCSEPTEQIFQ